METHDVRQRGKSVRENERRHRENQGIRRESLFDCAAVGGAVHRLLEFARVNNEAAFHHANELSGVKTPTEFLEITARHAREQLAVMTAQAKELATLGQQATLKAAEPFKGGGAKGFG
jgi:hypothetical protein